MLGGGVGLVGVGFGRGGKSDGWRGIGCGAGVEEMTRGDMTADCGRGGDFVVFAGTGAVFRLCGKKGLVGDIGRVGEAAVDTGGWLLVSGAGCVVWAVRVGTGMLAGA